MTWLALSGTQESSQTQVSVLEELVSSHGAESDKGFANPL